MIHYLGILISALTVRVFTAHARLVVPEDSVHYIDLARDVTENGLGPLLSHSSHPLYPLLLAGTQWVTGDFLLAGRILGIVLGVLVVLSITASTRLLFGSTASFFVGMFAALSPYLARQAGEILPEQLSVASASLALYFVLRAERKHSLIFAGLAGIFSGLFFLTRPEGLIFPFGLALGLSIPFIRTRSCQQNLLPPLSLLLGFTLVASPYWIALSLDNGYPTLSRRKIERIFSTYRFQDQMSPPVRAFPEPRPAPPPWYQREQHLLSRLRHLLKPSTPGSARSDPSVWLLSTPTGPLIHYPGKQVKQTIHSTLLQSRHQRKKTFELPKTIFEACHPILFLLGLWGLWGALRGNWPAGRSVLITSIGLQILLLSMVNFQQGYLSRRHALVFAVIFLPWSGIAFQKGVRRIFSSLNFPRPRKALWISFALVLAILSGKTLKVKGTSNLSERRVGEWIATHSPNQKLLTNVTRVALYAKCPYERLPTQGGYAQLLRICLEKEIDLIAVAGEGYFLIERLVSFQWLIPIDTESSPPGERGKPVHLYRVRFPTQTDRGS
jgi:4-amino-4-deoxy-L-arabinose transferase-like glycosyltransferase